MSQNTIVETDTCSIETESTRQSQSEHTTGLYERCEAIRRLLAKNESRTACTFYRVGVEVLAVKNDQDRYSKGSVETIARKLRRTAALLYTYASVVEAWPNEKRFTELADERNPRKMPLSFSHFVELAKIADEGRREELRRAALKERWSVAKLRRAMAAPTERAPASKVHNSAPARALPTQRLSVAIAEVEAVLQLVSSKIGPDAAELEALSRDTQRLQELVIQLRTRVTAPRVQAGTEGGVDVVWAS